MRFAVKVLARTVNDKIVVERTFVARRGLLSQSEVAQSAEEKGRSCSHLLVLVRFVCRNAFHDPRNKRRVNFNHILAGETSNYRKLCTANHETRGKGFGKRHNVMFRVDDMVRDQYESLASYMLFHQTMRV